MDDENADFAQLVDSIREVWGKQCMPVNVPVGAGENFKGVISTLEVPEDTTGAVVDPNEFHEPLIEAIIEADDAVMERYFEGQEPTKDEVHGLIVKAVKQGSLIPIVCCCSKNGVGVKELLNAIGLFGLSPAELIRSGTNGEGPVQLQPNADGPLAAKVFRTRIDPFVQKLNFIRVFSGTLRRDDSVNASSSRKNIKLGPLLEVQGESTNPVEVAGPGDIVAIAKMDDLHTGTVLGDLELPAIEFPHPW